VTLKRQFVLVSRCLGGSYVASSFIISSFRSLKVRYLESFEEVPIVRVSLGL
jgi:hypothetical protein